MSRARTDREWFDAGLREAEKFWTRLGEIPQLKGKSVLDVGCGRGALSVQMAQAGAECVVGIDTDPNRIGFASRNARTSYPDLAQRLEFRVADLAGFSSVERFDIVVSKDTFEHLGDVPATLRGVRDALKPGGLACIGFGPLYRSPFGDHGWTHAMLPWAHLVLPQAFLLGRHQDRHGWRPDSLDDMGLNRWRVGQFVTAFAQSGLFVSSFAVNQGSHPAYRLMRPLSRIPFVGELFAFNIYCILRKPTL